MFDPSWSSGFESGSRSPGETVVCETCPYWQIEAQTAWSIVSIDKRNGAARQEQSLQRGRLVCVEVERSDRSCAGEQLGSPKAESIECHSRLNIHCVDLQRAWDAFRIVA